MGMRADEPCDAGFDRFRPLGPVAQNEHGLPERRGLFLEAARIGQHEVARVEDLDEVEVVERLAEADPVHRRELRNDDLAHRGLRCTGNTISVSPRAASARDRARDVPERVAVVLTAVTVSRIRRSRPRRGKTCRQLPRACDRPEQRVDDGVAGDAHAAPGGLDSAARLRALSGVGQKWSAASGVTSRRFPSSGNGAWLSPLRRPASTCATGMPA